MIVGILSDTHDRVEPAIAAMNLLKSAEAEFFIHCGDVGGQRILDLLAGLPSAVVWGNNDWDRLPLSRYAESIGVRVLDTFGELDLGGKRFAVTHGDDAKTVRQVLDGQLHDYLLVGHSHIRTDRRFGTVRLINPGALHRAAEKSVAILDTNTDELRFIKV